MSFNKHACLTAFPKQSKNIFDTVKEYFSCNSKRFFALLKKLQILTLPQKAEIFHTIKEIFFAFMGLSLFSYFTNISRGCPMKKITVIAILVKQLIKALVTNIYKDIIKDFLHIPTTVNSLSNGHGN